MADAPEKVAFVLKDGFHRVEVNVQESDEPIVITDQGSGYSTSVGSEITALDAAEGVKRTEGRAKSGKSQPEPE